MNSNSRQPSQVTTQDSIMPFDCSENTLLKADDQTNVTPRQSDHNKYEMETSVVPTCSAVWHTQCFKRAQHYNASASNEEENEEDEVSSEEDFVHCSASDTETESELDDPVSSPGKQDLLTAYGKATTTDPNIPNSNFVAMESTELEHETSNATQNMEHIISFSASKNESTSLAKGGQNYCFVCGEAQSKIARHFKVHVKEDDEIAEALSLPVRSRQRKQLLEMLRNRGNFNHNNNVLKKGEGSLKVKRRAVQKSESVHKKYEYCVYCKGMFVRKDLWRHMRRCKSKLVKTDKPSGGRHRVLSIAAVAKSAFSARFEDGLLRMIGCMNDDEIGRVVRNDFGLLEFAQSLYTRHGHDKTKHEYMRQKLRELGRFLLTLRNKIPSATLEDAIKPANFMNVIKAVKETAGFHTDQHSFQRPSLALKIGHSLLKISEILHCHALIAEDTELTKCAEAFQQLYKAKWSEYISHRALCTISDANSVVTVTKFQ
ncbi:uncharacterized protein LOC127620015 isoform X3 [Xyrauchen texanus]|uniref:uncharacterized protein LOC127620015 isoform X2 n=1 Tax=Xyrauchen texanus TaxID=154827 RepID=UPI0022426978|nr:uncharacterized protein LOC127620015 isoform X2 [Xyrauchen texanus]XP_051949040.1 uncharacterized protein LOC127620015 isoform X3 [Xyrauchen texanus]